MDTDDLTPMAYESIVIAYGISDYLKCDLGVRSGDYKDEVAYLNGILKFVRKIKHDPENYLDYWNIGDELDLTAFVKGLKVLEKHILKTIETPFDKRGDVPVY
ncbi:MAG: hypothetical protein H8E17_17455 [Deltaproteobacteria bacterium]|nr:hypothetical protein [Deltaproteobacteria bacterium]